MPRWGLYPLAIGLSLLIVSGPDRSVAAADRLTPDRLFQSGAPGAENAEEEGEFETDRDSFTPSTITVARGDWVVESAWSFEDNRDVAETHSLPELVIRYGATDWLELRFGTNYEVGGEPSSVSGVGFGEELAEDEPGGEIERASEVSYGVKVLLSTQDGWRPESSLILMGDTPTSGPETATNVIGTYVAGWTFENGWKWDSALRYGTGVERDDHYNRWAPSTVLKVPVGESWHVHGEYFGHFTEGRALNADVHYLSPGVSWMATENLELGIRVGWGLNEDAANFFSNVGVGWRF